MMPDQRSRTFRSPGGLTILAIATVMLFVLAPYPVLHPGIVPVHAASPDFSVSPRPAEVDIAQGGFATSSILVTSLNGFTGTVSLTANGPSGITLRISPNSLSPPMNGSLNAVLNMTVPGSTSTGSYVAGITATSGGLTHTASVTIRVVPPSFSVYANTISMSVLQGRTGTASIGLSSFGFSGDVSLTALVSPSGPTASPGQPRVTLFSGESLNLTLTVSTTISTSPGNYTIIVTGNGNGPSAPLTSSVGISLSVTAGPSAAGLVSSAFIGGLTALVMVLLIVAVWKRRPPAL